MGTTNLAFTRTHPPSACAHQRACPIHNTSDRAEAIGPQVWRADRGIIERVCTHGVGHYDPDQIEYHTSIGQAWQAVHGCDGCCV